MSLQIHSCLGSKHLNKMLHKERVDIFTANLHVTVRRSDLERHSADLHDRHIERPSSEVKHEHVLLGYRLLWTALGVRRLWVGVLSIVACCMCRRRRVCRRLKLR
mmetsp:Transcript_10340/g.23643  ORF Transcript_10340/g.23643 Transcript_10340/m.23643 type:complete len:105 (-) Transcript_10340:561-875(-)